MNPSVKNIGGKWQPKSITADTIAVGSYGGIARSVEK